ncbi:Zn-ribbon domain-containing OB-fold protein [Rhodococcus koreensis]
MTGRSTEVTAVTPARQWTSVTRTESSEPMFDAAARGELILKRCVCCRKHRLPRKNVCRRCGYADADWVVASGDGILVTWGVHPARERGAADEPFGLVELLEGPWMESALDAAPDDLRVGQVMTVAFVRGLEGDLYPVFRIAAEDGI